MGNIDPCSRCKVWRMYHQSGGCADFIEPGQLFEKTELESQLTAANERIVDLEQTISCAPTKWSERDILLAKADAMDEAFKHYEARLECMIESGDKVMAKAFRYAIEYCRNRAAEYRREAEAEGK